MVKINNFISTSQATPTISTGGNAQLANLLKGASAAAAQKANIELQELEQSKRMAAQKGALAAERKRQADLALPQSLANIQKAQLSTLGTFLAIDEQDRKVNEAKEAKAYALNSKAKTELAFVQASQELSQSSGKDGSGLFENTKAWWDAKEKELIESAPSERAKLAALESFTSAKTRALGSAVLEQNERRKNFTVAQAQETIGVLNNTALENPGSYEGLTEQWSALAAQYKEAGLTETQIDSNKKLFDKNLLWNTSQGYLLKGDIASVKSILSKEENLRTLGESFASKLIETSKRQELNLYQQSESKVKQSNQMERFLKGNLSLGEKGASKTVENYWLGTITQVENNTNFSDANSTQLAVGTIFTALREGKVNQFALPEKITKHIGQKMIDVNNPEKALAYASVVNLASKSIETAHMTKNFTKQDIAVASELALIGSVLPPQEAVLAVRNKIYQEVIDPNKKQQLKEQWSELNTKGILGTIADVALFKTNEDFVEDVLNYDEPWYKVGSLDDSSVELLKSEYSKVMESFFYLHQGDASKAQQSTNTYIKQNFGVTEVNGKQEVMQFAPELVFSGSNMKYFNAEKERALKELETKGVRQDAVLAPVPMQGYVSNKQNFMYKFVDPNTGTDIFYKDENDVLIPAVISVSTTAANKATAGLLDKIGEEEYNKGRSRIEQYYRDVKSDISGVFGGDDSKDVSITKEDIDLVGDGK